MPKINNKRPRIVVITQGKSPVIVAEGSKLMKFPVALIPDEKIVDTNGAGDAFVGGFLSRFVVDGSSIE
uniref:Adenosine kinase n=1 Tax=Romanomermis culicivorax TaxID=13658 RepID=A0A915K9U0_ROMCU